MKWKLILVKLRDRSITCFTMILSLELLELKLLMIILRDSNRQNMRSTPLTDIQHLEKIKLKWCQWVSRAELQGE